MHSTPHRVSKPTRTSHLFWLGCLLCLLFPLQGGCQEDIQRACQTNADCAANAPAIFCRQGTCQTGGCEAGEVETCYTGQPETQGKGICRAGQRICLASGQWSACLDQVLPQTERCDRVDNDCDDRVDEVEKTCQCETPGAKRPCYDGQQSTLLRGSCQTGFQYCGEDSLWGACVEQRLPEEENCQDGQDNDCDGKVEEGCRCNPGESQPCYGGPPEALSLEGCKKGTQACQDSGRWSSCRGQKVPVQTSVGATVCVSPIKPCRQDNECTQSESCCNERCIDTQSDNQNCGACGRICQSNELCNQGRCGCDNDAPTVCDGECANLLSDKSHCGACGNRCLFQNTCQNSTCLCPQKHCTWFQAVQTTQTNAQVVIVPEIEAKGMVFSVSQQALRVVWDFAETIRFNNQTFEATSTQNNGMPRAVFVSSFASDGTYQWGKKFGGNDPDIAHAAGIVEDAQGNSYVMGHFQGKLEGLPTPPQAAGGTDIFLIKLDKDGNILWSKQYGLAGEEKVYHLRQGPDGSLYAVGSLKGADTRFGNESSAPTLKAAAGGTQSYFLAKWDKDGNPLWIKGFQSMKATPRPHITAQHEIILAGNYQGLLAEDSFLVTSPSLTTYDIYLMKLDKQGKILWLRSYGGPQNDFSRAVTSDSKGQIYFAGSFAESITFAPLPEHKVSSSHRQMFVTRLNTTGEATWFQSLGNNQHDSSALQIRLDSKERLYLVGSFHGYVDIGTFQFLTSNLPGLLFVRFNTQNNPEWAEIFTKPSGNFSFRAGYERPFTFDEDDNPIFAITFDGAVNYKNTLYQGGSKALGFDLLLGKLVSSSP